METAKVDIRKLQVLNDRINQCLDALNQVRFSVHGLGHTSPVNPVPFNPVPWGGAQAGPYGFQDPRFFSPVTAGLSHTPFTPTNPYLAYGQGTPFLAGQGVTPIAYGQAGLPIGAWNPIAGLSHSGPEVDIGRSLAADPLLAMRIAQTFPFVQSPVSPVTPIV